MAGFRGGRQARRDRDFGIDDDAFWRWWHREGKKHYGGEDLGTKRDADQVYQDWVADGCPEVK
jgi:hypothetical protein